MSDYIFRLFGYFKKFFARKKKEGPDFQVQLPPSRYATPLRPRSQVNLSGSDLHLKRQNSFPPAFSSDSRISLHQNVVRCPSQISLARGTVGAGTPFRPARSLGRRISNSRTALNEPLENDFDIGGVKSPQSEPMEIFTSLKCPVPAFEFPPTVEDRCPLHLPVKTSSECCRRCKQTRHVNKRLSEPKVSQLHECGRSIRPTSKIPTLSRCRAARHRFTNMEYTEITQPTRGNHPMTAQQPKYKELNDENMAGDGYYRSPDINNWIAYRNDTSVKFERTFKLLTKKKNSIGNVIDSICHSQWLRMAGIMVDRDATIFKQFAGCKIVLTMGEYKFLLAKICSFYDLDYWDVLRNMATFKDDEMYEGLITL